MRSEREIIERLQDVEERIQSPTLSIAGKKHLTAEKWLLFWDSEKRDESKPNTDDILKDILFELKKITSKE